MPHFNENDINEAKRRVLEMQNRVSKIVGDKADAQQAVNERTSEQPPEKEESKDEKSDDKSFLVILALILLLSHEKADNTLILALLYLLL